MVKQAKGEVGHVTFVSSSSFSMTDPCGKEQSLLISKIGFIKDTYIWDKANRKKIGPQKRHTSQHGHTQALLAEGCVVFQARVLYWIINLLS